MALFEQKYSRQRTLTPKCVHLMYRISIPCMHGAETLTFLIPCDSRLRLLLHKLTSCNGPVIKEGNYGTQKEKVAYTKREGCDGMQVDRVVMAHTREEKYRWSTSREGSDGPQVEKIVMVVRYRG